MFISGATNTGAWGIPSSENVVGKFVNVKITEASGVSLTGEIVR
ncbi:MAG: TRAM domain-containing protein [Candidatus Borkfalkia sp.]